MMGDAAGYVLWCKIEFSTVEWGLCGRVLMKCVSRVSRP